MGNTEDASKHRMKKRALTSLLMLFSFVWLVPSGIVIHFTADASTGRAHHIAMSAHAAASLVFLLAVVVHLAVNWKPLTHHMISKTKEYLAFSGEALIALVIVTALVLVIASHAVFLG